MHLDNWKRFWITISLACFVFSFRTFGQSAQLSLASGSTTTPGGIVTLGLSLNVPSVPPAGLQWTFIYSPNDIANLSVSPGPVAAAAGKYLNCAAGFGTYSCLLTGINLNTIASGVVAVVSVTLSPLVTTTSMTISNALGATTAGTGLVITSSGGTITVGAIIGGGSTGIGGGSTGSTRYLSDLTWTSMTNGWGPVEKDMSNGEQAAADGHTISIRGVTYAKGLGAHAVSNVQYSLPAAGSSCTAFLSDVGVDDETGGAGSVVFQVWLDGAKLFDSGIMTGTMVAKSVNVGVKGKSQLTLIINSGGNGLDFDHADWANARLTCP